MTWAASLPETYFTVWSNLFLPERVYDESVLLVHGGAGGIGSTAVQLGAAFYVARVFATVADETQATFCQGHGAHRTIDYNRKTSSMSFRPEAGGAIAILDIIGGEYFERNIKACAPDAAIVQLAFNGGSKVSMNLHNADNAQRLVFTGSTLRSRSDAFKETRVAENLKRTLAKIAAGQLKPVIHQSFNLAQAADAHRMMESAALGKIVLVP